VTVSPAYGRDYKSKAAVVVDFNNELDFIIEDFGDSYCGKPVNRAQLVELGYRRVNVRFAKLRKIAVIDIT